MRVDKNKIKQLSDLYGRGVSNDERFKVAANSCIYANIRYEIVGNNIFRGLRDNGLTKKNATNPRQRKYNSF